jgi:hypothetical protein
LNLHLNEWKNLNVGGIMALLCLIKTMKQKNNLKINAMKTKNIFLSLAAAATFTTGLFAQTINLDVQTTNPKCFGDNNGYAFVTPSGGVEPYSYYWSTGESTSTLSNVPAGDYNLVVVDAAMNSISTTINLTEPEAVVISGVTTKASAIGRQDGAIDVTVSGLTPLYNVNWTSQTQPGCSSSKTFVVRQNLPINIHSFNLNGLISNGSVGGHMPLVYPNPSNGPINFRNTENASNVEIYDEFGNLIQTLDGTSTNLEIGNYRAVIRNSDGTVQTEAIVIR